MTAATLHEDQEAVERRLIASVDPQGWATVDRCRTAAATAGKAQRCVVQVQRQP